MTQDTLGKMFWNRVERSGGNPAQQAKRDGAWKTLTWKEVGRRGARARRRPRHAGPEEGRRGRHPLGEPRRVGAGGLRHLLGGLRDHSRSTRRYPPDLIQYIVNDAGVKTLIVEDAAQLAKVLEVQGKMDGLEQVDPDPGRRRAMRP